MNSITKITNAIIELATETSVDEALVQLEQFATKRQNKNLVSLVEKELLKRLTQESNRKNLVISGGASDIEDQLLSMVAKTNIDSVTRDETDVLAGIKIVGEKTQLDLSVRRQLDRLAKELVTG